jgi:hypothetical protein
MSVAVSTRLRIGNWVWLLAILSAATWAGFFLPLLLIKAVGDDGGGLGLFMFFMSVCVPALVVVNVLVALFATGCLFMTGTRVSKCVAILAGINSIIFVCIVLPLLLD